MSWGGTRHQYNMLVLYLVVRFSCPTLWPHGLQDALLPCPSPTPRVCSNSCPLIWWCGPTISFSVMPFSSCLQSFSASGSFPMSRLFPSGGQSIGVLNKRVFLYLINIINNSIIVEANIVLKKKRHQNPKHLGLVFGNRTSLPYYSL